MNIVFMQFETPKGKYVFDRETNSILPVNEQEYEALQRIRDGDADERDGAVLKSFQDKGFCKHASVQRIEHPQSQLVEFHLKNRVSKVTLQVTQGCNLRCSYCAYSGMYNQRSHNNKNMSLETMKKSVDFLIQRSMDMEKVNVGFYGGEPLLMTEEIKKLLSYIKEKYPYKEIGYSVTTNGTLFSDEIIEFLLDNDFQVLISMDGPKEIHNKNRVFTDEEGSFDAIMENLQHIKQQYPEFFSKICFNTVIAPGSDYECINDFYSANDVIEDNQIFTATLNDLNNKEPIEYGEQYFIHHNVHRTRMLLSLIGKVGMEGVSKLVSQEKPSILRFYKQLGKMSMLSPVSHPGGPCIPGSQRPMVDVDGRIYPCERVSESSDHMQIGHVDTGFEMDKVKSILNIGQISEPECLSCWNFAHCGMCAAAADDGKGFSKEMKMHRCEGAMARTLSMMETICFLQEKGYDFEKEQSYA